MLSGIFTALALVSFLGVVFWAWDKRNVKKFEEAAQLPLEDEPLTGGRS